MRLRDRSILKRIARSGLDKVRQFLLVDAVETRLQLKNRDLDEYQRLLEAEHPQEVIEMEMTWSAQIEARARIAALQEGRKALVLRQLRKRFGSLPEEAIRRLEAMNSVDELDALGERLLTARSLDDLGLV